MGFLPDKLYLKQVIHTNDCSKLKSLDETTGLTTVETKLETDFLEYRFMSEPTFGNLEKETIVAEINGEQRPKVKFDFKDYGQQQQQQQQQQIDLQRDIGKESVGKDSEQRDLDFDQFYPERKDVLV